MTALEELPSRIDDLTSQVSQLRTEMRGEFSAVRTEMAEQGATIISTLRGEMADQGQTIISTLRGEMADQGAGIRGEIRELGAGLRAEMAERDQARATQTRVLYEDVISRIALLQEGLSAPKRKQRKRR